jgi:murein DD-endopeptidase MepM/ murein hydrolase activator NlpD
LNDRLPLVGGLLIFVAGAARAADVPIAVSTSAAPSVVISTAAVSEEPFVSPLGGEKYRIVSRFGDRPTPADPAKPGVRIERHEGIDLAVTPGVSVKAARPGKVLFAGFTKAYVSRSNKTEQAHLIIIRHTDGKSTRYVHLNSLRVRPMQEVASGQEIGTASGSDEWTEPVLHFEIRNPAGAPMDPEKWLHTKK